MDYYALARAAKWALEHPRFKQPRQSQPDDWISWIEYDRDDRPVKLCWARAR